MKFVLAFLLCLTTSFAVFAQKKDEIPLIEVNGQAEIKVKPDQAVMNLRVVTLDKDINKATSLNDDRVKKTIALAKKFNVTPENIQTSYINIDEEYAEATETKPRVFLGYQVTKRIVIIVNDLNRIEDFMLEVIKAGVNRVDGLEFKTTQLRKYKDQARAMAMKAAREKAAAMAGEIGQIIGKAFSIVEEVEQRDSSSTNNFIARAVVSDSNETSSFAPGQISITARVSVSFELK
jgi:uncharacterized protein